MKKPRIILFTALALVAVMVLSSCSFFGGDSGRLQIKDLLDSFEYDNSSATYTTAEKLNFAASASVVDYNDDLILFEERVSDGVISFDRFFVYNAKLGEIVYDRIENINTNVDVSLSYKADSPFTVTITNYDILGDSSVDYDNYTRVTTLYNSDGSVIAFANGEHSFSKVADYVYFDSKYYSLNESGRYEYAFAAPDFGKTLTRSVIASTDKYYYSYSSSYSSMGYIVEIYDKELKYVSYYTLPVQDDADLFRFVVLNNDKFFLQYSVEVDSHAEDYDVYFPETAQKIDLKTLLIDPFTGEETEIENEYVVMQCGRMSEFGLGDSDDVVAAIVPIVDKHVDDMSDMTYALIKDDGSFKIFDKFEGAIAVPMRAVTPDLWLVEDIIGRSFLVNASGDVVADITGYDYINNKYIVSNGKIFNMDLTMLYDFEAEELSIAKSFDDSFLLYNSKGKYVLFSNDVVTTLWGEDSQKEIISTSRKSFMVMDSSNEEAPICIVYNTYGEALLVVDASNYYFSANYYIAGEDFAIVRVYTRNTETYDVEYTYYKLY